MPDKSLTIALVSSSFLPALGGAEIGLHNIAENLASKGHRPIVITSRRHARALRHWKLPYRIVSYPPRLLTLLARYPRLSRPLLKGFHRFCQQRFGFDVWHVTFGFPTGVSVIEFATADNIPHIVRCVGGDIQINREIGYGMRLDPIIDAQVRDWLPRADRLIATTDSVVQEYHQLGIPDARIARITNGVSLDRFKAHKISRSVRDRLGIPADRFVFLTVGRNHPKKNFPELIAAAKLLRAKTERPFAIVFAGTGMGELEATRQATGTAELVWLHEPDPTLAAAGKVEVPSAELLDLYKSADSFVMPSLIESFGIVVVEAMAAGLPILATDVAGCRDVLRKGQDGLLVEPTATALADAMAKILHEEALRTDLKARAALRAEDFCWSAIVDRYLALYCSLIDERQVGAGRS